MLLDVRMRDSGERLFRRRSYVLLIFLPLVGLAVWRGEPLERALGHGWGDLYEAACVALVAAGLGLRAFTVGFVPGKTSGRNTGGQVARELNTTGIYSLTRNPLYLANCMSYLGVMLFTQDLLLSLAFGFFLVVYYERIILAEEAFLLAKFGDAYRAWAAEVPVFLPRLRGWKRPALPFSLRSVLRREYPGWLAAVFALALIDVLADLGTEEHQGLADEAWLPTLGVFALVWLSLHLLNRRTRLLRVPGR
ncbi:isoprenylcysteine carboxylmethyltransferase family protein [Amaricoccus sp.]|uniref:methyltransferase family protein n=1 Tax=Amaricoccus sp. TaxID=1872485 RepID=UPI00260AE097|nr:isoprenylcysteine carboxylmethyltransferase family protein [Amaricoccus sp.]HRO11651.1 isoprenylcysteine carboxylmethyltransferase family protein [Amaricoccus sp.]